MRGGCATATSSARTCWSRPGAGLCLQTLPPTSPPTCLPTTRWGLACSQAPSGVGHVLVQSHHDQVHCTRYSLVVRLGCSLPGRACQNGLPFTAGWPSHDRINAGKPLPSPLADACRQTSRSSSTLAGGGAAMWRLSASRTLHSSRTRMHLCSLPWCALWPRCQAQQLAWGQCKRMQHAHDRLLLTVTVQIQPSQRFVPGTACQEPHPTFKSAGTAK